MCCAECFQHINGNLFSIHFNLFRLHSSFIEYDYGSDEGEQYDYGSDGGEEGGDDVVDDRIEIENAFYEGDDLMNENPKKATELFEKVVQLESARGDQVKW